MALPALRAPVGTPRFLAAGHSHAESEVFADVDVAVGHSRKRRLWVGTDRTVSVEWILTAAQMAAVDMWFEKTLRAGERQFAALVGGIGGGAVWWTARWIEPYEETALHGGRWHVAGKLLLSGGPSTTPPTISPLQVELYTRVRLDVSLQLNSRLAVEFVARLTSTAPIAIEFIAALEVASTSSPLLSIGGGFNLAIGNGERLKLGS